MRQIDKLLWTFTSRDDIGNGYYADALLARNVEVYLDCVYGGAPL